jgi:signal transduction histidine kinase
MQSEPLFRHRFLSIALLGVLISGLSLAALVRTLHEAAALRIERAREMVSAELDHMARLPRAPATLAELHANTYVGLRGGWLDTPAQAAQVQELPLEWRGPLESTVTEAATTHARALSETKIAPSKLVLAVEPSPSGFVWTGYLVAPSSFARQRRWIASGLAAGTLLLVVVSLWSELLYRRDAAALNATLAGLGKDLTTPVPRPRIFELTGIAEGIRRLAANLAASRSDTERLQRELAHKERLAALGRVVAGVAHEVRNPLASIKLRLDLTAAGQALPAPTREAIVAASREICRLDRLVGDLLLVAGKKVGPRRAMELGELVRARAEALGPWAATQRVAVRTGGEGVADADPESVMRAVDNVLRNAVEAAPPESVIEARVMETTEAVELRVEDHGPGVEPTRQIELFEPFFTTKAEGSGLGLAISRAIARAHGGDLTYARAGAVTRFSLSLPRGKEPKA